MYKKSLINNNLSRFELKLFKILYISLDGICTNLWTPRTHKCTGINGQVNYQKLNGDDLRYLSPSLQSVSSYYSPKLVSRKSK
jgi:hypothetical protein